MTTFGDQVFQLGGAAIGGITSIPLMGGGAKSYFVDPANGATGNSGKNQNHALDSVGGAYAFTTDKQGDVIYLLNDGNTTGSSRELTVPLAWSNDNTHLVGCCAPTMISQRARITPVSGADLSAQPVISVSGHGNSFRNLSIGHWGSTDGKAARGVDVTGNRNYFENCHIVGITHANVGDEATACDLKITGEENTFVNCVVGVDTVARTAACASVEFGSAAARNIFKGCVFPVFADNAAALFVKADGAGDIDRLTIFEDCIFVNAIKSTATTMTEWGAIHASAGGMIILKNCTLIGATDWEAATVSGNVYIDGAAPTAATSGLGVAVAAS